MIFFGLMTSLAPLLIYQLITLEKSADTFEATYSSELKNKTDLTALLIDQSIAYNVSEMKTLADTLPFIPEREKIKHYLTDIADYRNDIKSITLFSDGGKILLSTSDAMVRRTAIKNFPESMERLFNDTRASEGHDVYLSEITSLETEPSLFIFTRMANDIDPAADGILMMEMSFDNIELLLSNFEDEMDGNKHVYLVDKQRRILFTHDPKYTLFDPFRDYQAIVRAQLNDTKKTQRHRDAHGDTVMVSVSTVSQFGANNALGWYLVSFTPVEIFVQKVFSTLQVLIGIGVGIIILTVIIAYLMAKNILHPIKDMVQMAKKLRGGNYTARTVPYPSAGEEIVMLANTFNEMAAKVGHHTHELKGKNAYIYFILDASPVFMMTVHNLEVDYINKGFLAYLGFTDMHEFLTRQKSFCSFIHQIDDRVVEGEDPEVIEKRLQESATQKVVYFRKRNDDISTPFITSIHCYDLNRKCIYTFTDITQIQMQKEKLAEKVTAAEAERAKQQQIMELQGRQAQMGELIGSIAHQWKQPLNALSLYVFDMVEMYKLNEVNETYITAFSKNLQETIRYMSSTIDDFKNYFQPSREKLSFDPKESIENILTMLGKFYSLQDIDIRITEQEKLYITGIKNEFQQVVVNILNNAKDAFIENRINDREITVDIHPERGNAVIEISDNAGGIPESVLPKIFDSYFSTKNVKEGSGIGLYMSRQIIEEKMGGTLRVRNIEGGASFTIILPLAEDAMEWYS